MLTPIKKKLFGRVMLFVKEKRLAYYTKKYKAYPHIEVRETSPDFGEYLARSRGLIASPSRGVVTQVLGLGLGIGVGVSVGLGLGLGID